MLSIMDAHPGAPPPCSASRSVLAEGLAAAVELLPDRGAGLLRDLGELAARER